MKIAFTICSNNFLAQARTMLQSLQAYHPEYKTFIYLVDEMIPEVEYSLFHPAEITVVDDSIIKDFAGLVEKYTIIEINSIIRPFIIEDIQKKNPNCSKLVYIDADMVVYNRLDEVELLLDQQDIILTPHFLEPLPLDGKTPFENLATNYGTFNVGFLALNPSSDNTKAFLRWWGERTRNFGHVDLMNGFFTDQIWFNLVPLFFKRVHVLRHKGYNMASWNLHERRISSYNTDGTVCLEENVPLVTYHFSNWNFRKPGKLSTALNRYDFEDRPDLVTLYNDYRESLLTNGIEKLSQLPCQLAIKKQRSSMLKRALSPGVKIMKKVWQKI